MHALAGSGQRQPATAAAFHDDPERDSRLYSVSRLSACTPRLQLIGLAEAGAREIDDITNCPGAYSCNLALTKSMNLGDALAEFVKSQRDPEVRKLNIHISGCPNSCGQHWTGDIGFYGNARKIDGKEVPYYQMLMGGSKDENGIFRSDWRSRAFPHDWFPLLWSEYSTTYRTNQLDGEAFPRLRAPVQGRVLPDACSAIWRSRRTAIRKFSKTGATRPTFSLQLGRGECAS